MIIQFKTKTPYFEKEESGNKSNTIRELGDADSRFDDLMEIIQADDYGGRLDKIKIINPETDESFERIITDVTYYDGRFIISWNSQEKCQESTKSELCKCGHAKSFHEIDDEGICIYGLTVDVDGLIEKKGCGCKKYQQDTKSVPKTWDEIDWNQVDSIHLTCNKCNSTHVKIKGESLHCDKCDNDLFQNKSVPEEEINVKQIIQEKGCRKPFQKVFKTNSKYPEDYLICGYTKIGDEIQFCLECQNQEKSELELKSEFCGYCKKPFDYDYWIGNEKCKHCGKFLDNPPYLHYAVKKDTPQDKCEHTSDEGHLKLGTIKKGCGKKLPAKRRRVRDSLVCSEYQLCKKCENLAGDAPK